MSRWVCPNCGEDWGEKVRLVECTHCFAQPGAWCRRPSDHSGPFVVPHVAREELALKRGVLAMCPMSKQATLQVLNGGAVQQAALF